MRRGGALDRAAQPWLYDRLSWFRLLERHCPPPGAPLIAKAEKSAEERDALTHFFELWKFTSQRTRLLQRALNLLYFTLLFFIGTCISIAALFLVEIRLTMLPVGTGVVGVVLLFWVSLILIRESRLAVQSIDCEVDHLKRYFVKHIGDVPREEKVGWWKQLRTAASPAKGSGFFHLRADS